jgi:hypothetical protein
MSNGGFISSLRLSATVLLVGQLLYIVVTQFHTGGVANNHPAISPHTPGAGTGRPCTWASSRPWRS